MVKKRRNILDVAVDIETLAPVLHGRLHDKAAKLNELVVELFAAIRDGRQWRLKRRKKEWIYTYCC